MSVSEQSINETNIDYDFLDVREVGLFIENVSYYVAGFVSRAIEKKINCENCTKILYINTSDSSSNRSRKLLSQKDRGGLYKPSETVMKICLETERVFRSYYNVKNYKQSVLFLTTQVKMN